MRRAVVLTLLMLLSIPAFALNRSRVHAGDRVGVLRSVPGGEADPVERALVRELRRRGIDAFDAAATYDDVVRGSETRADWYVAIAGGEREAPLGGIGVGGGGIATTVVVVDSDVAVQVRLYDGHTFDEVEHYDVRSRHTNVVPTGVGVGGRVLWAWLPLALLSRDPSAAIARDAAMRILQESR